MSKNWFVYIILCGDGSYYTGITTNIDRRFKEHKAGKASKYTAARGVQEVVHTESVGNRSTALKREAAIKRLSRSKKEELIE